MVSWMDLNGRDQYLKPFEEIYRTDSHLIAASRGAILMRYNSALAQT